MEIQSYRDLVVWQKAMSLAKDVEELAARLAAQHRYELASQMRRASYSIPSNIAEGSARKGTRDYRKFLDTAWGSLAEAQTALTMAHDLGYIEPTTYAKLEALATETSKTLFGLLRKISHAADRPRPR